MQWSSLYNFYDSIWYNPAGDANPRPTVWEADTLITKPTRHGRQHHEFHFPLIFHHEVTGGIPVKEGSGGLGSVFVLDRSTGR